MGLGVIIINFYLLDSEKQRQVANDLVLYLSQFFAQDFYVSETDLRNDYRIFLESDYFNDVVADFENEHSVTIAFLASNVNRVKLCNQCGEWFISYDRRNKQSICRKWIQKRYSLDGVRMNVNQRSMCELSARNKATIKWQRAVSV